MGELGDVFELIVTGPPRASAYFAMCRRSLPRGEVWHYRIWCSGDDSIREERYEHESPVATYVELGSNWWRWDETRGAVTNTLGDPKERANSEVVWWLRSHGRVAVNPDAHVDGREHVAGREAILVRTPERVIAVDAEYGITLRSVHRDDVIFEVDRIEFDAPAPAEGFEFAPPAGVELRAASSDRPVSQPVGDVAAAVSFRVFEPGPIVQTWPVDAQPWLARRGRPDFVTVRLRAAPIWIHQSPTPDPESFGSGFAAPEEWLRVVRNGVELDVREDPVVVRLVREGTHIELYGEVERVEELIEIALALQPVAASSTGLD